MSLPLSCFVCGLARDCAGALCGSLASVERLGECFQRIDLAIGTNDSVDETAEILTDWAACRPWATVFKVNGLASAVVGRTDRLAMLRNMCLMELRRRMGAGSHFDLMIVFDFDGVNENLTTGNEFCDLLLRAPPDWGGLFANQRQAYYDVWALRHPRWCPEDCWQEVQLFLRSAPFFLTPFRRESTAMSRYVGHRQVQIMPDHDPIEVESAFGGLGIYRTSLLGDAWYSGRDNLGREVCEHVAFNFGVRRAGAKLYIMPALLNDAPLEHIAPGSRTARRPWE